MKKTIFTILGFIGLGLTLIPSILVFTGKITPEWHKQLMLIGTVLWFVTAPGWLGKK